MDRPVHPSKITRCGVFEIDLKAFELRKHGLRLKLSEQPFQILAILLEKPGEIITRDELRERLWPGDTFVDFDHGLNNADTFRRCEFSGRVTPNRATRRFVHGSHRLSSGGDGVCLWRTTRGWCKCKAVADVAANCLAVRGDLGICGPFGSRRPLRTRNGIRQTESRA
jgi:hypothetical protein